MPTTKQYISNNGLNAYNQVAQEQAASNNKGNTDDYSAALLAQQQQVITTIRQYAPMVICTEGEYPAQPVAGTMYFRFPNE